MPLVVRWTAGNAALVRRVLAAAIGIKAAARTSITIPGLRLEIVTPKSGRAGGPADRLEVIAVDVHTDPTSSAGPGEAGGARFLALGWATVDLGRVAAGWPGIRWTAVPRDSVLGARALLGDPAPTGAGTATSGPDVVLALLEPDTEGRLAAALAGHGEGPAALYVGLPAPAIPGTLARLARLHVRVSAGTGPFGPGMAIAGTPASSPTLVIVPLQARDPAGGPARGGRGTIGP